MLDTHVVLHAKPLADIDWSAKLGAKSVRLVVPLRVVDEVDQKKYARRGDLQRRARKRLRLLNTYLEMPEDIRPGVQLEVVSWRDLELSGFPRPEVPADVDILDTCEALRVYASAGDVSMITSDVGMTIRAKERELAVCRLDDDMLEIDVDDPPQS